MSIKLKIKATMILVLKLQGLTPWSYIKEDMTIEVHVICLRRPLTV